MIPHPFFTLSDHLDFMGVTLQATPSGTRQTNDNTLQDRMRKTIGPWKGGKFTPLTMRSHRCNMYAFRKLLYKCNSIDLRVADFDMFKSSAKSFIYADLLAKPCELVLFRSPKEGA